MSSWKFGIKESNISLQSCAKKKKKREEEYVPENMALPKPNVPIHLIKEGITESIIRITLLVNPVVCL